MKIWIDKLSNKMLEKQLYKENPELREWNVESSQIIDERIEINLKKKEIKEPCPKCGSVDLKRAGFSDSNKRRFICNECGKYFSENAEIKGLNAFPEELMMDAVKLRNQGMIYKKVIEEIQKTHDLKVSRTSIKRWVEKYSPEDDTSDANSSKSEEITNEDDNVLKAKESENEPENDPEEKQEEESLNDKKEDPEEIEKQKNKEKKPGLTEEELVSLIEESEGILPDQLHKRIGDRIHEHDFRRMLETMVRKGKLRKDIYGIDSGLWLPS